MTVALDLPLRDGHVAVLTPTVLERFASHLAPPDADGHVLWTGEVDRKGYATFRFRDPRSVSPGRRPTRRVGAHRISFLLANGRPAAPDMDVHHECFNRLCQAHLAELDPDANARLHGATRPPRRRPAGATRRPDLDEVCPAGHSRAALSAVDKEGTRYCRQCARDKVARASARARASRAARAPHPVEGGAAVG